MATSQPVKCIICQKSGGSDLRTVPDRENLEKLKDFAIKRSLYGLAARSTRNSIDDMIIKALENVRDHMGTGWPDQGVPPLDPLDLGSFNLNVSINSTSVLGFMSDVKINGLSTFTIDLVHTNLLLLKANIGLGIPRLDIAGNYNITGGIGVLPIFGSGPFWLDALSLTFEVEIELGVMENWNFGVTMLDMNVDCNATDIHFENIMGGGDMADFVNSMLSSLGPDILRALEDIYMPRLEEAVKQEINQILQGSSRRAKDDSVNEYFDVVFANMRQSIVENGLDPIALPKDSDSFTISLFNATLPGSVAVGPGSLGGLASVHRAGDMELLYLGSEDEAVWKGQLGLIDLQVDYDLSLGLALFGKDLSLSLKLSYVHISFETDVFLHPSQIQFAYCNITELGPVHLKEKGAGPLDTPMYNLLANTILGSLHGVVLTTVEEVICSLLDSAFTTG